MMSMKSIEAVIKCLSAEPYNTLSWADFLSGSKVVCLYNRLSAAQIRSVLALPRGL
jgi:hypothetical protein